MGCYAQAANEQFQQRVAAIQREHNEEKSEIKAEYLALLRSTDELKKSKIQSLRRPDSDLPVPISPVFEQSELSGFRAECWNTQRAAAAPKNIAVADKLSELEAQCWSQYRQQYLRSLTLAYWAADFRAVFASFADVETTAMNLESLCLASHNQAIERRIADHRQSITAAMYEALGRLADYNNERIRGANQQRSIELERGRRAFAAGLSAAAAGATQGYNSTANSANSAAYTPSTNTTASASRSSSCSSDFQCGIGFQCVKKNYSGTGICMKAVNQYGAQTFDLPRTDSVMPKMPSSSDCKFSTDCPVGFTCDTGSGACIKR